MNTASPSAFRKPPVWVSVVRWILYVSLGTAVVGLAGNWWLKHRSKQVRAEWIQNALRELSSLSATNPLIEREVAEMSDTNVSLWAASRWINEHVVVFTNGEVLIYAQNHGGGRFGGHVLLGRDPKGRWFYSPYHFCKRMAMISGQKQPASLEEFSKTYSLREFYGTLAEVEEIQAPTPPVYLSVSPAHLNKPAD